MNTATARERAPDSMSLSELQQLVTGIWQRCLEREVIGLNDNFFDLGGNSISAMYIVTLINEAFSMDLPFQTLFELKDIGSVAELLYRALRSTGVGRTRVPVGSP